MINKLIKSISIFRRKLKYKKISYSYNAVDLIIEYLFKNKNDGFYVDIGCQHPISNNNTYLLFNKGWSGINIDLDKRNIELFKISRPLDLNLNYAISNEVGEAKLYYYHNSSPINTLSYKVSNYQSAKIKEIKKVKTTTLNNIFSNIKKKKKIDYMNIDVEGHELNIINSIDFVKYRIKYICIEMIDHNNHAKLINEKLNEVLLKNDYILEKKIDFNFIFKKIT